MSPRNQSPVIHFVIEICTLILAGTLLAACCQGILE